MIVMFFTWYPCIASYTLTIEATDGGVPQQTGTATITVLVNDLNDNNPVISATYDMTVAEDTPLRTIVHQIAATDADTGVNDDVQYTINSGNTGSAFTINADSGYIQVAILKTIKKLSLYFHKCVRCIDCSCISKT